MKLRLLVGILPLFALGGEIFAQPFSFTPERLEEMREKVTAGTVMREGIVYPIGEVADRIYYQGQWVDRLENNPYARLDSEEDAIALFEAWLVENSHLFPPPSPTTLDEYLQRNYQSYESLVSSNYWGEGNMYDWVMAREYTSPLPETDEEKAAFLEALQGEENPVPFLNGFLAGIQPSIPEERRHGILLLDDPYLRTEYMKAYLDAAEQGLPGLRDVNGWPLWLLTDLPGTDFEGVDDVSFLTTTRYANFADSENVSPELLASANSFDNVNASGLDMSLVDPSGKHFGRSNMSNTTGLTATGLASAQYLFSMDLRGTGITKSALDAALVAAGKDPNSSAYNTGSILFD